MASSMVGSNAVGLEGGHMHSSPDEEHNSNNGAAAAAAAAEAGNSDAVGTASEPFYDELEDTTGARQTLIQNRYCFWYYRKGTQKDRDPGDAYESGIKAMESFQTIEHFWRIYNHILRADQVPNATDVHLFRDGIKPTWEDPSNARGGQLLVRLKKGLASRAWESLVLAVVGEQFDVGNEICGAVVSVRYSEDVISVWNRSASNTEGIEKMRETLRRLLKIPSFVQVEYRRHQDNLGATRGDGGGGYPAPSPAFGPRGGPPGAGGAWTRNRSGARGMGGGGDDHKDGDRAPPAGMPAETWARGPPEARDRDREGGGFRAGGGGGGGMGGGFRPPPGGWADRREGREGGGGMKDFARDRSDREKDLEKWGKVRKDTSTIRERERDTTFRDREFRDRETDRDWGRLRRPGGPPGGLGDRGGGMRGGGGGDGGDHRRPPGGLAALDRASNAPSGDDGKGRNWSKLRQTPAATTASPDREKR